MVRHLQADSWKIVSAADDKTLSQGIRKANYSKFRWCPVVALQACTVDVNLQGYTSCFSLSTSILLAACPLLSGMECPQGRETTNTPVTH